jgi:hypothetical protein
MLYEILDDKVFESIRDLEYAFHVWSRLEEAYEGTSMIKSANLFIYEDKYAKFTMKDDESVPKMFHRLNMIVNELRALGHKVDDEDFSHKLFVGV